MIRRLATIDLGTNTVRLLVVEVEGQAWRSLHQSQRVTRLGEGQAAAGLLLEEPVRRTVETVTEFVAVARRSGASEVHIVGTSALREARNREEFVARVKAATGQAVRVVSGEEEARLTLEGVAVGLPELHGSFVLFDIGGGSTELVLARDGRPIATRSLELGVVPLAERFMDDGPVVWDRFRAMRREIDGRLAEELGPDLAPASPFALVGTAGTVTALAALDLELATYEAARVQGHVLRRAVVEGLLARLGELSLRAREAIPCLERGRADVLIPGIAICLAIMDRLRRESVVVSDRGLREGILQSLLLDDRPGPARARSTGPFPGGFLL